MRDTRSVVLLVLCVLLGGFVFGAVAQTRVVIGNSASIWTLDGSLDANRQGASIYSCLYDYLYIRDMEQTWQPALCLSHKSVDDLTWEFTLRQGVRTHEGHEFTAEDVAFTINRIMEVGVGSQWRAYISPVSKAEAVDAHTLRITTTTPFPTLVDNLALIPMLPKGAFERAGATAFASNPVGTGPYKFVRWVTGEYVQLRANPDHWRGSPPFEEVEFRQIPDDSARLGALLSGEVDIIVNVPPELMGTISARRDLRAVSVPSIRGMYVFFDAVRGPFADSRVRQAINYLIDVDELIETVMGGLGTPINNMVPPMYIGNNPYLPASPYPYDPTRAFALLRAAGYDKPFEIVLNGPVGRYVKDRELTLAIAGQLERHGFKVTYKGQEWGVYFRELRARQEEKDDRAVLYVLGYGAPHFDLATPYNEFLRIGSKINLWANGTFTNVLDAAMREMNPVIRVALLNSAHQMVVEEAPIIFLFQLTDNYGINGRIDWTPRSDEMVWVLEMKLK